MLRSACRKIGSCHCALKLCEADPASAERAGGGVREAEVDREDERRADEQEDEDHRRRDERAGEDAPTLEDVGAALHQASLRYGYHAVPLGLCWPRDVSNLQRAPMAQIALENLSKVYPDGTPALSDLTLDVQDGELVVFVGPSGCGKTTALRMVAGLEDITSGVVRIGERVVNTLPPKDRDVAMVFQNYALYPHMTAYDNMAFGLKMRSFPKAEIRGRVADAARVLGLEQVLKKKPRTLSGGQRQRVAMGRAIVREPQAFLMDEPLSNLDAKLRVEMRAEIARIQRDLQATTIYVTHDQVEAMTLGDRVVVLRDGTCSRSERRRSCTSGRSTCSSPSSSGRRP